MTDTAVDARERAEQILATRGDELLHVVVTTISRILGLSSGDIRPSAVVLELGAGSLDLLRIKFMLEQHYEIKIPDYYAVPDVHSVDAFVWAVASELAKK